MHFCTHLACSTRWICGGWTYFRKHKLCPRSIWEYKTCFSNLGELQLCHKPSLTIWLDVGFLMSIRNSSFAKFYYIYYASLVSLSISRRFFCFSTARRTKVVRNILERVPAGDEWQRIRCNKAAAKTNLSVSFALTLGNESAKGVSERRVSERRCVWTPCLYLSWCSCQCQQKINPRYTPNPLVHGIHRRFTSFSHVESNHPSFPHIFPMVSLWFPLYSWRFPRWIPRRLALLHWSPPARWWLVSWPSSQGTCGGCTHILLIHIINIIILVYHHNIFVIFVHNWYIFFVHINICTLYL